LPHAVFFGVGRAPLAGSERRQGALEHRLNPPRRRYPPALNGFALQPRTVCSWFSMPFARRRAGRGWSALSRPSGYAPGVGRRSRTWFDTALPNSRPRRATRRRPRRPSRPPTGCWPRFCSSPTKAGFFKLQGPDAAVTSRTTEFEGFVKSVRFEGDEPSWSVPQGWRQDPGDSIRFALLRSEEGSPPLEISVTALPYSGNADDYLLQNINRWRGQLQLARSRGATWPTRPRSSKPQPAPPR